ncbi:MAG: hypothetical protein EOO61_13425 [Hymenobacter sp.]|nr:MAG: hypothetical protein EOO61_13425 [Hymenobacter sp.]
MIRSLLFIGLSLFALSCSAQKYTTAAGIRLGGGMGLTVQQYLWDKYTAEAMLQKGFGSNFTTFTALLEQHHNVLSRGMNFYLGAGPHFGSYRFTDKEDNTISRGVFGASFIGGLEMKLGSTLLSFDYKPSLNLTGGNGFFDSQAGVSLRYVFLKAPKKEHKWMFWKKKKAEKKKE